jgi:predicted transcriptional regulator
MGNKNKTVSFRVNEETFEELRDIAENRDLSLSTVFREYVDTFVAHEGQVTVTAEDSFTDAEGDFPPKVEVSKEFLREHERLELEKEYLELEVDHLREQLEEHKSYINTLRERLDSKDDDHIFLEDLDDELTEDDEPFQIG